MMDFWWYRKRKMKCDPGRLSTKLRPPGGGLSAWGGQPRLASLPCSLQTRTTTFSFLHLLVISFFTVSYEQIIHIVSTVHLICTAQGSHHECDTSGEEPCAIKFWGRSVRAPSTVLYCTSPWLPPTGAPLRATHDITYSHLCSPLSSRRLCTSVYMFTSADAKPSVTALLVCL
jgi:hypothetical protein